MVKDKKIEVKCVKCNTYIEIKKDPHNGGWKCPTCGDEFKNEVKE